MRKTPPPTMNRRVTKLPNITRRELRRKWIGGTPSRPPTIPDECHLTHRQQPIPDWIVFRKKIISIDFFLLTEKCSDKLGLFWVLFFPSASFYLRLNWFIYFVSWGKRSLDCWLVFHFYLFASYSTYQKILLFSLPFFTYRNAVTEIVKFGLPQQHHQHNNKVLRSSILICSIFYRALCFSTFLANYSLLYFFFVFIMFSIFD